MASTPAMKVVLTAPKPGIKTPTFPDAGSILTPFCTSLPPDKPEHYIHLVVDANCISALAPARPQIIPIHPCDDFEFDFLRTDCFALANVGAAAEELLFKLCHHVHRALVAFRLALRQQTQMADLRSGKQRRSRIRTCGDTGAATDTGGGIHSKVRVLFGHRDGVSVGGAAGRNGNKTAAGDDAGEGASIDNEVLQHRKCLRAPRLEIENIAVFEMTHVQLADRRRRLGAMGDSVDHEAAHPTDSFTTVMIECNGFFTFAD